MKCIKLTDSSTLKVERVTNELALRRVESGEWSYTTKGVWKKLTRKET
ncbi:hypothetical protein LCGC14_2134090 [marine sediment metagenome]|uniref:Uncharacterized protein n=1 Tax=marine sediment metagenome TaxID=412755 RepID=A0A0F9E0H8_9ZZZZ